MESAIMREMPCAPGHEADRDEAILAQLAIELHKLPSEIEREDYNSIANILSALHYQGKKAERRINKK